MWKDCIWNPDACICENDKYLASIIYNSVTACDEIIEETKTVPTNLNEKKVGANDLLDISTRKHLTEIAEPTIFWHTKPTSKRKTTNLQKKTKLLD